MDDADNADTAREEDTAVQVAAAVLAQPGVARLDGGPFGTVASYFPGRRRVTGVRLPLAPGDPVEIALVAYTGFPLPGLADGVAAAVRAVLRGSPVDVPVDVTVSDVVPAPRPAVVRSAAARPPTRLA